MTAVVEGRQYVYVTITIIVQQQRLNVGLSEPRDVRLKMNT